MSTPNDAPGVLAGGDGRSRCPWTADPELARYHDEEWGRRVYGESAYFERLTLEAFQSGLSWRTILLKRPAFRAAFAGFDPERVAGFDVADRVRLLSDAGIVRNRAKVDATLHNARATLALREDGGLEPLVLSFAPETAPPVEATTSPESVALSKALKKRGFGFVGPTTMFALMQALGLFDPHLPGCFRYGAPRG